MKREWKGERTEKRGKCTSVFESEGRPEHPLEWLACLALLYESHFPRRHSATTTTAYTHQRYRRPPVRSVVISLSNWARIAEIAIENRRLNRFIEKRQTNARTISTSTSLAVYFNNARYVSAESTAIDLPRCNIFKQIHACAILSRKGEHI